MATNKMLEIAFIEGIGRQAVDTALQDVQFAGEQPRVALLVADATVTSSVRLDFG